MVHADSSPVAAVPLEEEVEAVTEVIEPNVFKAEEHLTKDAESDTLPVDEATAAAAQDYAAEADAALTTANTSVGQAEAKVTTAAKAVKADAESDTLPVDEATAAAAQDYAAEAEAAVPSAKSNVGQAEARAAKAKEVTAALMPTETKAPVVVESSQPVDPLPLRMSEGSEQLPSAHNELEWFDTAVAEFRTIVAKAQRNELAIPMGLALIAVALIITALRKDIARLFGRGWGALEFRMC